MKDLKGVKHPKEDDVSDTVTWTEDNNRDQERDEPVDGPITENNNQDTPFGH